METLISLQQAKKSREFWALQVEKVLFAYKNNIQDKEKIETTYKETKTPKPIEPIQLI